MSGDEEKRHSRFSLKSIIHSKRNSGVEGAGVDEKAALRATEGQAPLPIKPPGPQDETSAEELRQLDSKVVKVGDVQEQDPYRHLPEHEAAILRRQVDIPEVKVGFFTLYRYASRNDWIIWGISCVCTIAAGAAMPLMTVVFGNLTGLFSDYFNGRSTYNDFVGQLSHLVLYFVYLAVGEFVTVYVSTLGFIYVGEHCTQKVREQYLKAMLSQNIAFFDKLGAGEITTRITADTNLVQDGISEKFGLTLNAFATFIAAFVIAFVKYWKLTLILMSIVVSIVLTMGAGSRFIVKWTAASQAEYAKGGTVAEEVVSSIRNATAFNTQDKLARQYDKHLEAAENYGKKLQGALGILIATMMTLVYLNYALSFWQGSRFLVWGDMTVSDVLTVLFAVMIGAFSMGNVAPNMKAFTAATAAGHKIFAAIDRKSPMDPYSDEGEKPTSMEGSIELRNVKMIYPSRPEVVVMEDVNLHIPAGKQTALVGASGSGKSTIVGLVERFYDPVGGEVLLDGKNVQDLNLHWLRRHVSLVQQEPVLFSNTIYENIRFGLLGTHHENSDPKVVREMIENAAKMANAHDFITSLTEGYETHVGERGFLLSGGQKQRVAIARAIVSDPRVLLLDEATSALDTKSEGVVQAALDKAAVGRTTIIIAHRLSTIRHADNIVVMQAGRIVEQGKHDELLDKKGAYFNLVEAQRIAAVQQNDAAESSDTDVEKEAHFEESCSEDAHEKENMSTLKRIISSGSGKLSRTKSHDSQLSRAKLSRTQTGKSIASVELAKRKEEKEKQYSLWQLMKVVWSFNKDDKLMMIIGFLCSVVAGGGNPTQAVFFAKAITALSLPDHKELRREINFWAGMYTMLAATQFIALSVMSFTFGHASERLVHRARNKAFRTMLRQDIAFFDKDENNAGALTSFLSTSVTHLAGLSGQTLGTILNVSTTLVAAIVISLSIGWKLALVCTSTIPVLLVCGFARFWMLAQFNARAKKAYERSAGYACEATSAIRTVASLTREEDVWSRYHEQLEAQKRASTISVAKSSTLYAASQSFVFLCIALGFWYGGTLIAKYEYTLFQFFVCFSSIIFGAQSAGTIFSFAPDMGKAKQAAQELQTLFDRKPTIDSWSEHGEKVGHIEGNIEFRDVHFRYPTRPEQPVLRGLSFTVKPGQYVALVGASGCGKSTTIALLERFYDPIVGGIFVDGKDISSLHLNDYRSYLALVSQEPTLYQGTIRENILMGADRDDVSEDEIIKVCKEANIYDFITSLP